MSSSSSSSSFMDLVSNLVQNSIAEDINTLSPSSSSSPTPSCSAILQPKSFFMAWNGVPCLVFNGFPHRIANIKRRLNDTTSQSALKHENFGSKWPKVTLGYPVKSIETVNELERFKQICFSMEDELSCNTELHIPIHTISMVHYNQRSLENIIEQRNFHFWKFNESNEVFEVPPHSPPSSQEEQDRVSSVLEEWDDTSQYIERVRSLPTQPYRVGSPQGYCCVVFLKMQRKQKPKVDDEVLPKIFQIIHKFRHKVDEVFPNRFEWMDDQSLHCTIRAMDPYTTLETK